MSSDLNDRTLDRFITTLQKLCDSKFTPRDGVPRLDELYFIRKKPTGHVPYLQLLRHARVSSPDILRVTLYRARPLLLRVRVNGPAAINSQLPNEGIRHLKARACADITTYGAEMELCDLLSAALAGEACAKLINSKAL